MEAVFLNILELSLRGSLLILAILPIRALLKKAPRWSICLLWVLAAIALVCPVRFESTASVVPADSIITEIIAPAPTMPLVQTEPIMIPDIIENGTPVPAPAPTQPDYAFIATLLWLMGMAVMLSVAAVSYVRLKKQVAASLPVKDKVYLCDDIDTPFILGIVRPRIYLPSTLDTALYSSVLLHEYAHLKRRDHWWKPLGYLLLTVHWFNPLVWLGYVLLCRDIELACDEKVIRDMDSRHKKDYSEALLQCSMPRRLITACPLAFGEVGAKQRIKAVLNYKKPAFWVILVVLLLCAALAVGFLTDPKVNTLGEMSELTAEDIGGITVNQGGGSARSVTEIEAACEQLSKLELKQVLGKIPFKFDNYITLYPHSANAEYFLWFNEDCTLVYLGRNETQDGKEFYIAEAETYKVVNPEVLEDIVLPGFASHPNGNTLGRALDDITTEMKAIYACNGIYEDENSIRSAVDYKAVCDALAQVEIHRRLIAPSGSHDGWHSITLYLAEKDAYHRLVISPDFSALRYLYVEETDRGQTTKKSPYYEVTNPAQLESLYRSEALFKTGGMALSELSDMTAADIRAMAIYSDPTNGRSVANIDAACEQLSKLDLLYGGNVKLFTEENRGRIELRGHDTEIIGTLYFPPTYSTLWIADASGETAAQYQVLNPDILNSLIHSEIFYQQPGISSVDSAVRMEFTFSPPALETAITEYLGNKNKNIANLTRIGNVFSDGNTYYTVVSMDYTARDGSVISENNLYLAQIRWMDSAKGYFLVEGLAKGEWGSSAGYYPNVADFGGQTVIWTTRNATHVKVFDGGVGSDGTVPNEYDTYRITCASGAAYDWKAQNATGVYLLPKGETAVRVAPLYNNKGYEVSAFAFDMSNIETVDVRTISEQSGWNLFMEMDANTGTILELYSNPVSDPPAPDTHESLLTAAVSEALHFHTDLPITVTIEDEVELQGRHFAMVQVLNDVYCRYLVEYTVTDSGYAVTAWDAVNGLDANAATYGYSVSFANFHGTKLGWIHTVPDRTATSNDGTELLNSRQANDYTAIRFTMDSGKTIDTKLPKDLTKDRLALQVFDTGTPLSAVPLVGKTQITACAIEFAEIGGYGDITNGFFGHEALLSALRSHPELIIGDKNSLVLLGRQHYGDYEYAVISYDDHEAVLVEYTLSGDTVTLLNYAVGHVPDTSGMRTGYRMNESNMEGGILYWSLYAPRYKLTPNGKDVDESLETVTPDFSGFRFTMRDLKTHDFPADDSFFLCEFTGVIPPAIVTPMEKGKLLAALGSEVVGGLTGTISLKD